MRRSSRSVGPGHCRTDFQSVLQPCAGKGSHAAALNTQPSLCEQANRFRIRLALLLEDPGGEGVRSVVIEDRHHTLQNDRALVVLVVGEVDGTAADLHAAGEDSL